MGPQPYLTGNARMLTALQIYNFVTIVSLEIDFSSGMTTLTGETGAGKSILVDALGLVLGDKADSSLIRSQCERAEITAQFTLPDTEMTAWLEQQDIPTDDECIIRRVLNSNGRSKAYINGSMVTLALLDEFGSRLIDIHASTHTSRLDQNKTNASCSTDLPGITNSARQSNRHGRSG